MEKKKQQLLEKTYRQFMKTGIEGDNPSLMKKLVDDKIMGFGTAIDEKVIGSEGLIKLIEIQKKQAEGLDMSWRQEPMDRFISDDENTAVFADDVFLTIKTEPEDVEMYMRFTTVLNYRNTEWKVIHWHGSKPEEVESEKDTWGIENWKQKAEELEQLVEEKTADLVAKNRELEIEAALERVRARTMAMHDSIELEEVAVLMYGEFLNLGFESVQQCGYAIINEDMALQNMWLTQFDGNRMSQFSLPLKSDALLTERYKAWKSDLPNFYQKTSKSDFLKHLQKVKSGIDPEQVDIARKNMPDPIHFYNAHFTHGYLHIVANAQLGTDQESILIRFAKVFEQTYTRFLDLQKAEAQAREAQIEAALERVRARALAMHSSKELEEVALELRIQMGKLGQKDLEVCAIHLYEEDEDYFESWGAVRAPGMEEKLFQGMAKFPKSGIKIVEEMMAHYYAGDKDYVLVNDGEKGQEWLLAMKKYSPQAYAMLSKKIESTQPEEIIAYWSISDFKGGALVMLTYTKPDETSLNLLRRAANVFQLAYRRYLDLQKAEDQAREAQIEAALEKVRSRSLAMHRSEEFPEVIQVVFEQFRQLNFNIDSAQIDLSFRDTDDFNLWTAVPGRPYPVLQHIPYRNNAVFNSIKNAKKAGLNFISDQFSKEEKNDFFELFFLHYPEVPEERKRFIISSPGFSRSAVLLSDVMLGIQNYSGIPFTDSENEILKRFAKVFEQTYTRFLDLQKAEAQAREAQIEAGLERVRARTMAMHKSEELGEVSMTLYSELQALGITQFITCGFCIYYEKERNHKAWITQSDGSLLEGFDLPIDADQVFKERYEAWKRKEPLFIQEITGKIRINHISLAIDESDSQLANDMAANFPDPVLFYNANFKQGYLNLISGEPLGADSHDILIRFSKVFEQTYTRFLDLQKAEEQAKEAEIQLALERVRAKTMAMNTQSDLLGVIKLFGEQLNAVNLRFDNVTFIEGSITKNRDWDLWSYVSLEEGLAHKIHIPYTQSSYFIKTAKAVEEYEKTGQPIHVKTFTDKEKNEFLDHYWKHAPKMPQEVVNSVYSSPGSTIVDAFMGEITVSLVRWNLELLKEEELAIFERFSKEFRQTYIRFLDIKKAEAQAREAKIEASLERVRSRTMGMHKSEELSETASVVFQQFNELGYETERINIAIINEDERVIEFWSTEQGGKAIGQIFKGSIDEPTSIKKFYEGWKNKQESIQVDLQGKELKDWITYVVEEMKIPTKEHLISDRRFHTGAYFSKGLIIITNPDPIPCESLDILKRFAKVFEQTYTRFLDLQKAEDQAREAEIQLALERVRARTMAMQKSEELADAAFVLFEQLRALGGNLWGTGFGLCQENVEKDEFWFANENGVFPPVSIPNTSDPAHKQMYLGWQEKTDFLSIEKSGASLKSHYDYMLSLPEVKPFFQKILDEGLSFPEKQQWNAAYFSKGYLLIITLEPYPEPEIFKRFAKVFEQTYTRFLDLQKAEAQAREAEIQLALERVRARSMAMQSSDELHDVLSVLFRQFDHLGIHPVNVFLSLFDRENRTLTYRASGKSGTRTPGKQVVHVDSMEPLRALYEKFIHDNSDNVEVIFYSKEVLPQLFGIFSETFESMPEEDRMGPEDFPEGGYSMAGYTPFGYLGYDHQRQASEEEKEILSRFCLEFTRVYQRFLDIQKAEEQVREAQIEAALERVRARTMAMHKSNELSEVAAVLFEQLKILGANLWTAGFAICRKDEKLVEKWMGSPISGQFFEQLFIPYDADHGEQSMYDTWLNQVELYSYVQEGKELKDIYDHLMTIPSFRANFQKVIDSGRPLPVWQKNHVTSYKYGYLLIITEEEFKEEYIFPRFAKVFEQAYTRFLDLQKAETQTREAKIEAALERVRARAMAMHHPNELSEVLALMFDQLSNLEVDAHWTHLTLINLENNTFVYRMTSKDGKPVHAEQVVQLDAMDTWSHTVETFKSQNPETVTHIHFLPEVLPKVWELFNGIFSSLPKGSKINPEDFPNGIHTTEANCKFGYLGINQSREATAEEKKILARFASEFGRLYQRYLDIEKAQKQAREAQIEASLERVRARAMAMHQTDELTDVLCVLFDQFDILGINPVLTHLTLFDEANETFSLRITTSAENRVVADQLIDIHAIDAWKQAFEQWKICEPNSVNTIDYAPEDLPYLWELLSEVMEALPDENKISPSDFPNGLYTTQGHFRFGYLGYNHTQKATEEEKSIVSRFAREFGRTYQRFLDLQKAEAQAREAKIEASLEKIRARTMGMQSSSELPEVANLLFLEIQALGIPAWSCGYNILAEDRKTATCCMSSEGTLQTPFQLRLYGEASFEEMGEFIRSDNTMLVQELGGKALEEHYAYMKSFPDLKPTFDEIERLGLSLPTYQINHLCKFNQGFILFITYEKVPESQDIFKRFTNVFDQTYTRFLDLEKAEAQAREAQIEAALERVRSRTMGMQKAEELGDVAIVLFHELNVLVDNLWTCGFVLCEKDRKEDEWWLSADNGLIDPFFLPNVGDYAHETLYEGWKKGDSYRTVTLENEQLHQHYDWLMKIPIAEKIFEEMESSGIPRPNWQRLHAAYFKTGYLVIITEVPCEEEDIFKRFAQVFDLTYTRFLDLKKAENQAREAQIEAALEKVRSRSLAMQDPEELTEVAQLLREEMGNLGVEELETSSIYIHDENTGQTQCWFTIKNNQDPEKAISDQMTLDLQDTWVGRQMLKFNQSKENKTSILMKGDQRVEWIRYCESKSELLGKAEFYGDNIPERTYHLYKFSNGFLGSASPGPISEESWDLMRRATAVFSFAFTRFLDLQGAQASAKAALRQASLDRVRADISSMRKAEDLDKITPLLFKELNILGIPFIRCGVFIIHEKNEIVEAYLSSSEGESLGALRLPFNASDLTYQTVKAWRKEEVYRQHWDKEDFVQWIQQIMEKDLIQDEKTYQGAAAPPESLFLHFIPFLQGMIYVGSTVSLTEDEIDLVKSLSEAFAIAYSRYEDFVKLEQAKAEIESAMSELKATQTQLVQQEKLASLGQLTAGIAHEIKNPLNFVNNFSELNKELIEEVFEELENMPTSDTKEEIISILEDIKSNLSKVHEHGSRANGIVTSMLQHSRGGTGKKEPTNLNSTIKEYVNLAFHGMRAGKDPINVAIEMDLDESICEIPLVTEDFSRVIVNLCNNAFDAMREKSRQQSLEKEAYQPKLSICTKSGKDHISISIEDNGPGIPNEIKDKVLQPFFTTKKGTQGTGLGLSITNDIVKAHGGELAIETALDKGTNFIIKLST
ncbi:GHKL domain-containing protein [Algoriphagus kandeliae]|uniref:histidine kinase n=1 Tax=Algoriphagus kandeliae TaxID=2562278 RepID=A0A4Y9QN37_9BACT|nr:ATP-binding protein [Algoriphagus kandeliae]TFV93637.1 GHKL domain-containing protein [Algoriphagus kandeliae]